jgi:hypothetical protein
MWHKHRDLAGPETGMSQWQAGRIQRLLSPVVGLTLLLLAQSTMAADDVRIWVRAFIPSTAASSSSALLRASDGGCITTDQRTWSDATVARSRLASDFHLLVDENVGVQVQASGPRVSSAASVRAVDCDSGVELTVQPGQLLTDAVRTPTSSAKNLPLNAKARVLAAVPDPLRAGSSATIHYDATFTYNAQSRTLEYQASTGVFPAYEAYARLNDGPVVTVFRSAPAPRGETATATSKAANSIELKGTVQLADLGKRPKAPTGLTVQ